VTAPERARPPLRALRHEPLFIDDQFVADRLRVDGSLPAETARWARAWLVCWHAALVADARFGLDDPWAIALPLDGVVAPRGAGGAERLRVVRDALVASGVLVAAGGDGRSARWQVAQAVFTEHAAAVTLDWPGAVTACGAEPAALLVLRALADLVVPLDAPAAVPRRDLVERTGYQQKQVRVAVRRLVAADLIAADGDVGTTARYRFTPRALGRVWSEPAPRDTAPRLAPNAAPNAAPNLTPDETPDAAPPVRSPVGDGVQLVIGGATLTIAAGAAFEIAAGVAARLELGPDGRPRLVIRAPDA
jgi:hypothetical protein